MVTRVALQNNGGQALQKHGGQALQSVTKTADKKDRGQEKWRASPPEAGKPWIY